MQNIEELYRLTLIEIAETGNEKAKLALSLGNQVKGITAGQMKDNVSNQLKIATKELQQAIKYNGISWTRDTDACINRAQSAIMNAMEWMTK